MRSLGIGAFFGIGENILNPNNQERLDAQKKVARPTNVCSWGGRPN